MSEGVTPSLAVASRRTPIVPVEIDEYGEAEASSGAHLAPRALSMSVVCVAVDELRPGFSPRDVLIDELHVQALMEVLDRVPPIIVHGETSVIIDGVHRWEAARRLERATIPAQEFAGNETDALLLGIQLNTSHGKPLTRHERQAAARLVLARYPDRSDRWIAAMCGLSHVTVGKARSGLSSPADSNGVLDRRLGRDGRLRQVAPKHIVTRERVSTSGPDRKGLRDGAEASPQPDLTVMIVLDTIRRAIEESADLDSLLPTIEAVDQPALAYECRRRANSWAALAMALERSK